jgi:hypothetical protein
MPRDVLKEILGVKAKQERGWDHRKALMHQCILIYINVIVCVCGLGREEVDDETEGWMLELLELMQLQAVRKTHLFCAVLYYTNTIFLPSQARDKHRETALKKRCDSLSQDAEAMEEEQSILTAHAEAEVSTAHAHTHLPNHLDYEFCLPNQALV